MAVDNNMNLISQICNRSGLQGEALEALKKRLESQSREELEAELINSLIASGDSGIKGLGVEHSPGVIMREQYAKNTYNDDKGRNITE